MPHARGSINSCNPVREARQFPPTLVLEAMEKRAVVPVEARVGAVQFQQQQQQAESSKEVAASSTQPQQLHQLHNTGLSGRGKAGRLHSRIREDRAMTRQSRRQR